jgi:hypothetical protein
MHACDVSAVIVTRGDVDLDPILDSLPFDDVVVWNNRLVADLGVYGRFAGVEQARNDVVFVQDDDCIVPTDAITALLDAYAPGRIVSNMPTGHLDYTDSCLVGLGAVFDAYLPRIAFSAYLKHYPFDDEFT